MENEKTPQEIKNEELQSKIRTFAKQLESMVSNSYVTSQKKNPFSSKFTSDNVTNYLSNPMKYEKELRKLSTVLLTLSPQYLQVVNYYSSISKFIPIVIPNMNKFTNVRGELVDPEKLKKEYLKCVEYVDNFKVAHNFQKALDVCMRDDVFYGYVIDDGKGNISVLLLDADYCQISSTVNSTFQIYFDFSYFDTMKNIKQIGNLIDYYPQEFQKKYNLYLNDKTNMKLQELDYENVMCFKFQEMLNFVMPKYANLFSDISSLTDYKEMAKASYVNQAYKFISFILENKTGNVDEFTTSIDTVLSFYQMLMSNLPEGISAFIAPTKVEAISFPNTSVATKNEVSDAENSVYNSSGISSLNFGKDTTNAGTMKLSNKVDESTLFKFYRQVETWLDVRIKRLFNEKFTVKLLDVTTLSLDDEVSKQIQLAQYGLPNKLILSALAGISQHQERGMLAIEQALDLSNTWKPLNSSFVQSGTGEVGNPEKDVTDLTDSGMQTQTSGSNDNRI